MIISTIFKLNIFHIFIALYPDLRDWRSDIGKEILVPINLQLEPVQIKTMEELGPEDKLLSIRLFGYDGAILVRVEPRFFILVF